MRLAAPKGHDVEVVQDLIGLEVEDLRSVGSGGKIAFVTQAIVKANGSVNRVSSSSGAAVTDSINALAKVLKKEDVNVHIDLPPAIAKCSLRDLPQYCYPKSVAVDYLATEASKLRKKGIESPFVYVDPRQFLPQRAEEQKGDDSSDDESAHAKVLHDIAKALGASDKPKRRTMPFHLWSVTFDKYALAADVPQQLPLASALCHKDICSQVAMQAHLKGRRHLLGVFYDEVCRKAWANSSRGSGFVVSFAAARLAEAYLRVAEAMYDQTISQRRSATYGQKSYASASWNNQSWKRAQYSQSDSSQYKRPRY